MSSVIFCLTIGFLKSLIIGCLLFILGFLSSFFVLRKCGHVTVGNESVNNEVTSVCISFMVLGLFRWWSGLCADHRVGGSIPWGKTLNLKSPGLLWLKASVSFSPLLLCSYLTWGVSCSSSCCSDVSGVQVALMNTNAVNGIKNRLCLLVWTCSVGLFSNDSSLTHKAADWNWWRGGRKSEATGFTAVICYIV